MKTISREGRSNMGKITYRGTKYDTVTLSKANQLQDEAEGSRVPLAIMSAKVYGGADGEFFLVPAIMNPVKEGE